MAVNGPPLRSSIPSFRPRPTPLFQRAAIKHELAPRSQPVAHGRPVMTGEIERAAGALCRERPEVDTARSMTSQPYDHTKLTIPQ